MSHPLKAITATFICILLAGCSSEVAPRGSSSPVNLKSGCGQSGAPVAFTRGGGDQFYYCTHP